MYKIQTNNSGTRHIDVSEENLQTIEKYALLDGLVASNGIVDESTLEKLKQNVRSFVMQNDDGLRELIMLYLSWSEQKEE